MKRILSYAWLALVALYCAYIAFLAANTIGLMQTTFYVGWILVLFGTSQAAWKEIRESEKGT